MPRISCVPYLTNKARGLTRIEGKKYVDWEARLVECLFKLTLHQVRAKGVGKVRRW
jgi:hypothetical protein